MKPLNYLCVSLIKDLGSDADNHRTVLSLCSQAQDAAGFRMTLVQTHSDQHWTQGRVITVQHLAIKLFQ